MTDAGEPTTIRFGHTQIQIDAGDVVDQPVQAVFYPANRRGVVGAGRLSAVRIAAGADVEREAMASAPHDIGTAIATSSGGLAERGIETILHVVIADRLGDMPERHEVRHALAAGLRLADERRIRTVAIPLIGVPADAPAAEREDAIGAMVDEIVAYVRRGGTRLELIVLTARFADDVALLKTTLARARERSWMNPS